MGQLTITPEGYAEIKSKIKDKLNETTNNFIIIGYYLKQVRDSGAYVQDGYHNMEEFAQGEYRLSASTASRFMDINTRFSEGGNSLQIKEEYCNYGYSKLQEMLTVKENDMELITPDMTVAQIREIKKVEKEEDQEEARVKEENLPLMKMSNESEPAAGQQETVATSQYSPLEEILIALWKDRPAELLSGIRGGMITGSELAEELSPSGSKTFTSGTYMLFMYTENVGVKFRYYANGKANIETYTYDQIIEITNNFVTDELFREITSPQREGKQVEAQPKQENTVQIPAEKKQTPPVEKPSSEAEETYKTLPGQMTFYDTQESEQAAEVQDAEYCEIQEVEEIEYTQIEIDNAIGYFETEYNRMAGMGIQSTKSRNYKMALDAIRKVYRSQGGNRHDMDSRNSIGRMCTYDSSSVV
jgi:hypothetical protein